MTRVTFRMEGDRITGFDSKGHSGYAEAGSVIVCAAVTSAIRLVGPPSTTCWAWRRR